MIPATFLLLLCQKIVKIFKSKLLFQVSSKAVVASGDELATIISSINEHIHRDSIDT
jgi:hypothetical protein